MPLKIAVSSLAQMPQTAARVGATKLVTLLASRGPQVARPHPITEHDYLRLHMNDVAAPAEGMELPASVHLETLIDFAHRTAQSGQGETLLIHCWAGISRSTAAAYITAASLLPQFSEHALALHLRAASPTASPNRLMIELADALLQREGRMIAAIEAIGQGVEAQEGIPFELDLWALGLQT
jgi:predicted protein tyrosine phosphatase